MKRFFLFTIVLMAAAAIAVAVVSCKKEKVSQVEVAVPQAYAHMQAEIDRIIGFKKQVETRKANQGMKSAETVTLDEAMNNIVDLFNVTYTEPMAYYTESERHYFTVSVALTADGKMLLDDVVSAYEQALANAREVYHSSALPDKAYQRLMVTCTPQRDGTVELMFDGKYGSKADPPEPPTPNPHHSGPFQQGDDWHYMDGMGRCCDTCVMESGADKELERIIMEEVLANRPVDPDGYRGFYTNFRSQDFCAPRYTGVFYRTDVDDTCIEWEEMNDCLAGEKMNIYQVIPQEIGINLNGNLMQTFRDYVYEVTIDGKGGGYEGCIWHNTEVVYARYNYIENEIIVPRDL